MNYLNIDNQNTDSSPTFEPELALIFHSSRGETFVTTHDIQSTESGDTVLGAGKAMCTTQQKKLAKMLLNKPKANTSIKLYDDNILYSSSEVMIWYVKQAARPMYFKFNKREFHYDVIWPSLIFVATKNSLQIAAFKGKQRPNKDTELFHAPLMNIYADGDVCLGSAKVPRTISLTTRHKWESAIYDTNFSHINHENTLKTKNNKSVSDHDLMQFWRKLNKQRPKSFPQKHLNPMGLTLNKWIASL